MLTLGNDKVQTARLSAPVDVAGWVGAPVWECSPEVHGSRVGARHRLALEMRFALLSVLTQAEGLGH